jgi:hypothetical protein
MADATNPPPPCVRLSVGITGHRAGHPAFAQNEAGVAAALTAIFAALDQAAAATPPLWSEDCRRPVRFHSLLANGTDQVAAELALARGWELVAPLPFGRRLNEAINALPVTVADARALANGDAPVDPHAATQAAAIRALMDQAHVFELAECDDDLAALFLAKLAAPDDFAKAQLFTAETSVRVAQAGRILIEQSDIIIGVWDGATTAHVGGTGHTITTALGMGAPVIWIDPAHPGDWRILRAPEALTARAMAAPEQDLAMLVTAALHPGDNDHPGIGTLDGERWRAGSNRLAHAYRRVETLFGSRTERSRFRSLRQTYAVASTRFDDGSDPAQLAAATGLASSDPGFADRVLTGILSRFRWADGVSAWLSDAYRGGMIINFVLSSLAVIGGMAYLPLGAHASKWAFALFELVLLAAILAITWAGQRHRWHGRWFETRRVAEYLRHAPLLMMLGVARAPGRWPRGSETSWPEFYARHVLRDVGLPRATVTATYLRTMLTGMIDAHVTSQRDYHMQKAEHLATVHHNLDRVSTLSFQLAVVSVALYLALRAAAGLGLMDSDAVDGAAKIFTLLGVSFPTIGAGIAGIRYFGDFERFAAISEVTAQKLDSVHARVTLLAAAPDSEIRFDRVAQLAHATDEIVFAEIENWQSVFGGKHMTVPV